MEKITASEKSDILGPEIISEGLSEESPHSLAAGFPVENISDPIPQLSEVGSENEQMLSKISTQFSFMQRCAVLSHIVQHTYRLYCTHARLCFMHAREKLQSSISFISVIISVMKSRVASISHTSQLIFEYRNLVTEISIFIALMTYGLGYFLGRASIMFLGTVISLAGVLLWSSPIYAIIHYWLQCVLVFFASGIMRIKSLLIASQSQSDRSENCQ